MRLAAAALALVAMAGCGGDSDSDETTTPPPVPEAIRLESPAFQDGGELPTRFTCDGEGVSPPLRWSERSVRGARDLALVVEDPDAPGGGFIHWTVWKLPFEPAGEGRVLEDNVAPEMDEAENDAGDTGLGAGVSAGGRRRRTTTSSRSTRSTG